MNAIVRVKRGDGESHAIAGAQWTWKVRSAQAGGQFCCLEMVVEPGQGVPLHLHSYAETFYIIEGELDFKTGHGVDERVSCSKGDVVTAGSGVPHGFFNRGDKLARLLSISAAAHELFFDSVVAADQDLPFSSMSPERAFSRVIEIGALTDTKFIPELDG